MEPGRWQQIEEIYSHALSCAPGDLDSYLRKACREDEPLRREVESLLAANDRAGSFLGPQHLSRQPDERSLGGRKLDHYVIGALLGSGGMGDVFAARDEKLDRPVAIKVLPSEFTRDPARLLRFQREARAASSLNHPNIITIYDIGDAGGIHYIATEFIEGRTLRELLAGGALEPKEAVRIAAQCASALDAAHRAGIIHRDIKPENIMVRPDGLVKILDFGLASIGSDAAGSANVTNAGAVLGTPRYMSPEQARGQALDARTDIFSLGTVLYEMVSGVPCFTGATNPEVFAALLSADPAPRLVVGDAGLRASAAKALAKDPGQRYQAMREFAHDLESGSSFSRPTLPRLRPQVFAALGLITATLLAAYLWIWPRMTRHSAGPAPAVVPITSFAGNKDHASFSPDGNQIAFAWNGGSATSRSRDIYVKGVGAGEPLRIAGGPEDEFLPAWSPDGQQIAYLRADAGRWSVHVVPALGGTPRKVIDAGVGLSWSPDGKQLAMAHLSPPAGPGGIFLYSLATGEQRILTQPGNGADGLPVFSPDGNYVGFTRTIGVSSREIFVVDVRGGEARQLTFDKRPTHGIAWTADSREILFSSNRRGDGETLWRIPVEGGTPERVSVTLQCAFFPAISRKGDRLAYTETYQDVNIDRYDGPGFAGAAAPRRFGEPQALILSSREDTSPAISPDGERIAFISKRTGSEEIWVSHRDGGHPARLTSFGGPPTGSPRWSPDGRWLAFDTRISGNPDIFVVSADGGAPRQVTSETTFEIMPAWSADGKSLYFNSNRGGSAQIWRMPFEGGGAPVQITTTGAREPIASPDGNLLYFTKNTSGGFWSVAAGGGEEKPVPGLAEIPKTRSWGVLREGLYFLAPEESSKPTVRFYSFATRTVTPLLTVTKRPFYNVPGLAIAPDARWMLLSELHHEINDIMLIEGFQ